jgi:hypothetical protein
LGAPLFAMRQRPHDVPWKGDVVNLPKTYLCAVCDEWIIEEEPHTDPQTGEDVHPYHCTDCGYVPVHEQQGELIELPRRPRANRPHPSEAALRAALRLPPASGVGS